MNPDWHTIIQRHMDGLSTDEESAVLKDALKHDDTLARLYLSYLNMDVALEAQASKSETTRNLLLSMPAPALVRRH
ncbi:MAG: hypothetical protein NTV80_26170, partial [Verrucomicrobia bacterium]|nr:hypothetical protein [Verrucomicrobiota bacterium]